jgi:hypothetical protein
MGGQYENESQIDWEGVDWIYLARNVDKLPSVMKAVINLWVP